MWKQALREDGARFLPRAGFAMGVVLDEVKDSMAWNWSGLVKFGEVAERVLAEAPPDDWEVYSVSELEREFGIPEELSVVADSDEVQVAYTKTNIDNVIVMHSWIRTGPRAADPTVLVSTPLFSFPAMLDIVYNSVESRGIWVPRVHPLTPDLYVAHLDRWVRMVKNTMEAVVINVVTFL